MIWANVLNILMGKVGKTLRQCFDVKSRKFPIQLEYADT